METRPQVNRPRNHTKDFLIPAAAALALAGIAFHEEEKPTGKPHLPKASRPSHRQIDAKAKGKRKKGVKPKRKK